MISRGATISILPILALFSILLSGCDFSDPDEGYDGEWSPDHEQSGENAPASDVRENDPIEDPSGAEVVTGRRPADIIADTAGMEVREGVWEEERVGSSDYRAYYKGDEPEMIIERTGESTRSYFFNDGVLFYYTEEAHGGGYDLTVEFDDFGDVRGAQKLVDGHRVPPDSEDFAAIVERATEIGKKLRIKN